MARLSCTQQAAVTSTATDPSPFNVGGAEPSRAPTGVSFAAWLPSLSTIGPLGALVLAVVFFSTRSDRFLTSDNLSLVLQQVAVVGILAIGQTLIILTAGVDLSV